VTKMGEAASSTPSKPGLATMWKAKIEHSFKVNDNLVVMTFCWLELPRAVSQGGSEP
jgi:hypothetical protein